MNDYRMLPAVEPVDVPLRFSQTLLAKADDCPRSAYLYVKHRGGPGSHEQDRGTLAHAVLERAMKTLIAQLTEEQMGRPLEEKRFSPDDPEGAAAIMATIVDEVLRERSDLVVPRREVDDARELAYHWAVAYDVDPEHVAGIERLMVLDLECGWTISGKLDLIALPSIELGQVDDYKTTPAPVSQEEYEGSTQPWVYAALLCFGVPVDREPCEACDGTGLLYPTYAGDGEDAGCVPCEGRGYFEVRGEAFGQHLRGVLCREVYPRARPRDDGTLHRRELLLSRTAIADYKADLERMATTLAERFETWDFPASSGSWCSQCPAAQECPLPAHLRDYAGTINSADQAAEAWERTLRAKQQLGAVEREVKNFARAHDVAICVGDEQWRWQPKEGRAVKKRGQRSDWEGLVAAIEESVQFGAPFDVDEWVTRTTGSEFKKSKVVSEQ